MKTGAALSVLFFLTLAVRLSAQDTLPRFTVIYKGNGRNIISWTNPFPYTSQISIQRSSDSTKNFKTILTVPDANVPQNGYVDTKGTGPLLYYRLFIVLDSGKYQFSRSKRPAPDTARAVSVSDPLIKNESTRVIVDSLSTKETKALKAKILAPTNPVLPKPEKFFIIKRRDTVVNRISEKFIKKFRDSINRATATADAIRMYGTLLGELGPLTVDEILRELKVAGIMFVGRHRASSIMG